MKKIIIIFLVIIFIAIIGGGVWYFVLNKSKACTQEAKFCPDGTTVGRTGPNCEFAECPIAEDQFKDWKTDRNEEYEFEVKYPGDWRIAQCGIDCWGFGPQSTPEDIAVGINVLNSKLDIAKKSLPVLSNSHNKIIKEEMATIKGIQWTKLTIKQDTSEEIFIEYLIEKNGKTYNLGVGTDELNIVSTFNQILSTFKFIP